MNNKITKNNNENNAAIDEKEYCNTFGKQCIIILSRKKFMYDGIKKQMQNASCQKK